MSRPSWPRAAALLLGAVLVLTTSCTAGDVASPGRGSPARPGATTTPPRPAASTTLRAPPTSEAPSGAANRPPGPSPAVPRPPAPLIVIDPGHSGRYGNRTDRSTGLRDIDYPNFPEIYEMFDVSTCLARALRADGYRVLLTKRHALSRVGHRERAEIANRSGADLAISLHDDHGRSARFQATYSQRGVPDGEGRYGPMYRGSGRTRTVFDRPRVARASETAARTIAKARSEVLRRKVAVTQNSFDGRAPLEPGNLALVQLFATVPWVYNEMGARTGGSPSRALSIASERNYAAGLLAGVEAAVPLDRSTPNPSPSAKGLTSCLREQVEPKPGQFSRPRRYLPTGL